MTENTADTSGVGTDIDNKIDDLLMKVLDTSERFLEQSPREVADIVARVVEIRKSRNEVPAPIQQFPYYPQGQWYPTIYGTSEGA